MSRPGSLACALALALLASGLLPLLAGAEAVSRSAPPEPAGNRTWYVGDVVRGVDTAAPLVALTFDDGPREPYTSQILDVLRDQGVKATFFLVGENVVRHPEVVRRIVREGHAVGNHSWSHPRMGRLSFDRAWDEVARADAAIRRITGVQTTLFRPPYGDMGGHVPGARGVAGRQGHLLALWSVEVRDWSTRSARRVAVRTLRGVRPGSIVLLHDGGGDRSHTVIATRWMVAHLSREGYRMVTLPELLTAGR